VEPFEGWIADLVSPPNLAVEETARAPANADKSIGRFRVERHGPIYFLKDIADVNFPPWLASEPREAAAASQQLLHQPALQTGA